MSDNKFCPIRSTNGAKVMCESDCAWIREIEVEYPMQDKKVIEYKCAIVEIADMSAYLYPEPTDY